MHYTYIIYTEKHDKFYIGETVNVQERIDRHNQGFYTSASTAYANDWVLKMAFETVTRTEALKIERYLKSMKSKKILIKLTTDNFFLAEFVEKIQIKLSVKVLKCFGGSPE